MLPCIIFIFLDVFFPIFRGDLSLVLIPGQGTAELLQSFCKGGCEGRGGKDLTYSVSSLPCSKGSTFQGATWVGQEKDESVAAVCTGL